MSAEIAIPIVLAAPVLAAAVLAMLEHHLPRWITDTIALVTALGVAAGCGALTVSTQEAPVVYFVGGWPGGDNPLGIVLWVDAAASGLACLAATLATLAFLYTFRDFRSLGGLFHALVLLLLGGAVAFFWSGDLFTMFVALELMGVCAYSLTAFRIERAAPIQGAFHLAVIDSLGTVFFLFGLALLYGATGKLCLAAIGASLPPGGRLVPLAFGLTFVGLAVKAGLVPFHFAHADAHTVAPTPVLVLLSGVLLTSGVYAIARVDAVVFADVLAPHEDAMRGISCTIALVGALVSGVLSMLQAHLKRLLAFASLSHVSLAALGPALATPDALAGAGVYLLAFVSAEAALFLLVGIVLFRYGSVDERQIAGAGRGRWLLAAFFVVGALALLGVWPFGTAAGKHAIVQAAESLDVPGVRATFIVASVVTAAAVLRATLRVFVGWGGESEPLGAERTGPTEPDAPDECDRVEGPLERARKLTSVIVLLASAVALGAPALTRGCARAAHALWDGEATRVAVLEGRSHVPDEVAALAHAPRPADAIVLFAACVLAMLSVLRSRLPARLQAAMKRVLGPPVSALHRVHSGRVDDYAGWLTVGAAVVLAACALL